MRPILLNSCACAATGAEARYRIQAPVAALPAACVIALDAGAAQVSEAARADYRGPARFLTLAFPALDAGSELGPADLTLRARDGSLTSLSHQLDGAALAILVATSDDGSQAAAVIGAACHRRGVMMAALAIGRDRPIQAAVAAMRPVARVLLVTRDESDLPEVLAALRA